ncbi:MAG: ABC transporter ATP-binding protein [Ignisphaera sp.]
MDDGEAGNKVIVVEGVVKKYGNRVVLHNIYLDVVKGDKIVIIGPNGSGKTTLIKILLGLTTRNQGVVRVLGVDPKDKRFDGVRKRVGYMPEKTTLMWNEKVEEYLDFIASIKGCHSYEDQMELLGLAKYRDYRIKNLSQGYKRRTQLAAALLCNPELLILDEPYANIDLYTKLVIDDLLNSISKNTTMLMTTHIEPILNKYTAVIMMDGAILGKISVEDTIQLILACGDEKVELGREDIEKVNSLIRQGCKLEDVAVNNIMNLLKKLRKHRVITTH